MTRDEMLALLKEGYSPVEVSIRKWQNIISSGGKDLGKNNCALCELYCGECDECPLVSCGWGSLYEAWSDHHEVVHEQCPSYTQQIVADCAECVGYAQDILDALQQLLEDETADLLR